MKDLQYLKILVEEIQNIGSEKLDEIFEKNSYMQKIYPEGTRDALEVFRLYEAAGEFFDIDQNHCLHCGKCAEICPKQTIKKVV